MSQLLLPLFAPATVDMRLGEPDPVRRSPAWVYSVLVEAERQGEPEEFLGIIRRIYLRALAR